ncbi:hypothetical protein Tco_0851558 [Tanacetum coccineum]
MSSGVTGERPLVDGDVEEVGDLSLESLEDEEVAMVDGVFEGAFGELEGLEMEALVDAMEQFSQILSTIRKSKTPEPEAPTFAITTRTGVSTQDPPFLAPPRPTSANHTEGATEKEGLEDAESSTLHEPAPRPSIFYQPSKSSNLPFPSRLKKQKKDDENEKLPSIFKQIHINLPFLEAMIHMPKGAKVLKDLVRPPNWVATEYGSGGGTS